MANKIQTYVELGVGDIALCCDHETGEKLIKEIDSSIADWDFTLCMAKWFISQLREEREAVGETFDIGELIDGN
jgi:hypothetical protein